MTTRSRFNRFSETLSDTRTEDLYGYLGGADPRVRADAVRGLFEQCRGLVDTITKQLLRPRFKALTEEAIQEAWLDCFTELSKRSDEFLKERAERPVFREVVVAMTMRAVWRLEKRARVESGRWVSLSHRKGDIADNPRPSSDEPPPRGSRPRPPSPPAGGRKLDVPQPMAADSLGPQSHDHDQDLDLDAFERIFALAWERLLVHSSTEQRQALNDIGQLAFFADDWAAVASGPTTEPGEPNMTTIVLESRRQVAPIIDEILVHDYALTDEARTRFLTTVFPSARANASDEV
ncbi:MAG: hypothetical protein ABW321_07360 [Polyangiales bacterium]